NRGIAQDLLYAVAHGVMVVLGLNHRDGHTLLPRQHIVRELLLIFVARGHTAAHDHRTWCECHLASYLPQGIPARVAEGRGDEQIADIGFAEGTLIFGIHIVIALGWSAGGGSYALCSGHLIILFRAHLARSAPGKG